ncbi:haloacid dehalogenase-like hydrolase [Synechococcus sp. BSF8S]|uniref:HAD family hydrolase n=2 Tax=Cyanophyceae TaxID=3028117 RepID=UPI001626AC24|nr:HAD family hydrolase [Synechococcus sp. BSA11S]MBC1259951.1 haloacid dehalogenase-like hydrolase [Synechococcus sp. BSF8S]MBC1262626.1 haloacid dehalogenase-like hydrolase [Synechococcus sp. BSA11S]
MLRRVVAAAAGSLLALMMVPPLAPAMASELLPSWRDGATRARILDFIASVSREGGETYVPPEERIAVFDNDGTLWSEQPMYVQLAFAIERARAMVAQQPELASNPIIAAAAAAGNGDAVLTMGIKGLLDLVGLTHAGMSTDVFRDLVREWLNGACHPTLQRPYTALAYQPMLELLDHLRANGFRTYIVSAGGEAFMRVFAEEVYGIPPEQVIGSSVGTTYAIRGGLPVILRQGEVQTVADRAKKPVLIEQLIGRRPIAAFGNSDGDFEMLEWTTSLPGPRLGVIVHHDDPEREVAYDRQSAFGHLDRALREAPRKGWTVVSMRDDWASVFAAPSVSAGSDGEVVNRCAMPPGQDGGAEPAGERGTGELPEQPAVIPGEVPRIEEAPGGRQP